MTPTRHFRPARLFRQSRAIVLLLLLSLVCCAPSVDKVDRRQVNADFSLSAEVLDAMENGPLVVRVSLHYTGKQLIDLHDWAWSPEARLEVPDGWIDVCRPRPMVIFGSADGSIHSLKPGERWTETHYLRYRRIPPGKARVKVSWEVRDYRATISYDAKVGRYERKVIARPSATIHVDIPRATPENLRAFAGRLREELSRPHLSKEQFDHIVNLVLDADHEAFVPLLLQLFWSPWEDVPRYYFLEQLYRTSATPRKAHALLLAGLLADYPAQAVRAFYF